MKQKAKQPQDDAGMDFDEGPRAPPKRDRSQNINDTSSFMEGQSLDNGSMMGSSLLNGAGNDNYLNDFRNQAQDRDDGSARDAFEGIMNGSNNQG